MMRRSGRSLQGTRPCILNVESLEDRRLLSAANLLAGVLPTPPLRPPIILDLAAALPLSVLVGPGESVIDAATGDLLGGSVLFAGNSGPADDAGLLLAIDVEVGLGLVGLRVSGDVDLNLGGGAGLHAEVGTHIGLGTDDGLEPEVGVGLHLSGGAGVNPGDEDGVDLPSEVGANVGPGGVGPGGVGLDGGANLNQGGGVDLNQGGGADLNLADGAGPGGSGEPLSGGGLHLSTQDSSASQGPVAGLPIFGLFGFTGGKEGESADRKAPGDSEPPVDEEVLERAALLLLADLPARLKAEKLADEPFGVAGSHLPSETAVVQVPGGDAGTVAPEEADLSPEDAGLLVDCAPFHVPSLEQLLPQFLTWLDDLGEELVGLWAGLETPPWVLLALAAAAAAGEVARRNLGRRRPNLLDAAFAPALLE